MRTVKSIIVILTMLSTPAFCWAGDNGITAMDFLNIGVSARNAGTGEALAALSEGAIAAYYNPAGLTMADNYQISAMHSEWFQDLRYEYLGLAAPAGQRGNFGASFSYLSLGAIDGYSSSNVSTGSINAYDWSMGLSYGRRLSERLSMGAGAKIIGERLDDVGALGYAGDLGAQYRSNKLGLGLALMNLGPNIKYERTSSPLPSRVETGLAYWPWGDQLAVLTGVGVPFRGEPTFKAGLEYTYAGALVLRGGFDSAERNAEQGGFSMGAGFKFIHHSIDYAYNANSVMGGTHQFSFVLRFGKPREDKFYSNLQDPPISQQEATAETIIETAKVTPIETPVETPIPAEPAAATIQDTLVVETISEPAVPVEEQPGEETAHDSTASTAEEPMAIPADVPVATEAVVPVMKMPDDPPAAITAPITPVLSMPTSSPAGRSDSKAGKPLYLVCAGRYGHRADAEKYVGALEKFGYSSKIEMFGQDDFRVILAQENNRSKAEKKMKDYKSKGITCFIEEKQ